MWRWLITHAVLGMLCIGTGLWNVVYLDRQELGLLNLVVGIISLGAALREASYLRDETK